jgi:hypothetical protein
VVKRRAEKGKPNVSKFIYLYLFQMVNKVKKMHRPPILTKEDVKRMTHLVGADTIPTDFLVSSPTKIVYNSNITQTINLIAKTDRAPGTAGLESPREQVFPGARGDTLVTVCKKNNKLHQEIGEVIKVEKENMKGILVYIRTPKELDNTPNFILELKTNTLIRAIRGRPVVF